MPLSIFRRNFSLQWRSFGRLCVVLQYDIDCRPLDIVLGGALYIISTSATLDADIVLRVWIICPFVREDGLPSIKIA